MAMYNPNRNGGYGISGAKNVYTSKVRIGNWVEDKFGGHLASRARPDKTVYKSCSHAEFDQFNVDNDSKDGPKLLSTAELKSKNKDGLNYALIFAHGPTGKDIPTEERFGRTSANPLLSEYAIPQGTLAREKAKKIKEDVDLAYRPTTSARAANVFVPEKYMYSTLSSTGGESAVLPVAKRRDIVSTNIW